MDVGPLEMGAAYALFCAAQDRQTEQLATLAAQAQAQQDAALAPGRAPAASTEFGEGDPAPSTTGPVDEWSKFIGQEPLKRTLMVYMTMAEETGSPLPHTLLATGFPGFGKTTLAKLIAKSMERELYELMPPFTVEALAAVVDQMWDNDILLIDEIHRMALGRSRGAEMLLKVLEEGTLPLPDGTLLKLPPITVIGCTTDADLLPEPVLDRFKIKPSFQPYSITELSCIAIQMAYRRALATGDALSDEMSITMAMACRGTPRILDEMVMAMEALIHVYGRTPTDPELLSFLQLEPDGLTRQHVAYLANLYRHFGRRNAMGRMEYICGESAMTDLLRETKPGINRLERYLQEVGLLERTPRGRRLTERGLLRVTTLIKEGKG